MLRKYGFFARIGAFAVDLDSPRGAASFLRAGADVLSRPDRVLWVAAQGRFADPRAAARWALRAGVGRLAELAPDARFLPLAIEYAFWTERGAEALAAFGAPHDRPRAARAAARRTGWPVSRRPWRRPWTGSPPTPSRATRPASSPCSKAGPGSAASTTAGVGCGPCSAAGGSTLRTGARGA